VVLLLTDSLFCISKSNFVNSDLDQVDITDLQWPYLEVLSQEIFLFRCALDVHIGMEILDLIDFYVTFTGFC